MGLDFKVDWGDGITLAGGDHLCAGFEEQRTGRIGGWRFGVAFAFDVHLLCLAELSAVLALGDWATLEMWVVRGMRGVG